MNLPLKAPEPEPLQLAILHEKSLMETEFPRPDGEFSSKWPSISGSPSSQPITKSLIFSAVFRGRASFFQPKNGKRTNEKHLSAETKQPQQVPLFTSKRS